MFKKKFYFLVITAMLLSISIQAKNFSKVASTKPVFTQSGKHKQWCPVCGMGIKKFYKTSHDAQLLGGGHRQYCSIRCLVVDTKVDHKKVKNIRVVDAKTEKLIDAKSAYYVVGSKVKGTMSRVSKIAFANKSDARLFIKSKNGKIVNFDTAFKMAEDSLKSDIAMINKKKRKKMYPMGKKLYIKNCKKEIDFTKYSQINDLKSELRYGNLCKKLKAKPLQALTLYLWEVKRVALDNNLQSTIHVTKDEKCPVCGMFTYKYPRWAAQIFYKHNNKTHHHSFDGVKDMMKFYFNPMKWGKYNSSTKNSIDKIIVTDYYSQKAIDATKAYYVIGSDVYGPMGHELIPFGVLDDAKTFKADHRGVRIIKFNNINSDEVYALDE